MRTSKLTEGRITLVLRQAKAGSPVRDIFGKLEIASATLHRCRKRLGSLGMRGLRELRGPKNANRRLMRLVSDLNLEKVIL